MKAVYKYAFEFKRTVDHLKAWSVKLPSVFKETKITFHTNARGHTGLRRFTYQNLPQLKYHNPDISYRLIRNTKTEDTKCAVEFLDANKQVIEVINAMDLGAKDIQKMIDELSSNNKYVYSEND